MVDVVLAICFLTLLILGLRVLMDVEPGSPGVFFGLFCLTAALVSFAELMASVASGPAEANAWGLVSAIWPFASAFFLHMALRASGRRWVRALAIVPAYLVAAAMSFVFVTQVLNGSVVGAGVEQGFYLTTPDIRGWPGAFISIAQTAFLAVTAAILVIGALRSEHGARRRQIVWILVSYLSGALFGLLVVMLRQLTGFPVREITALPYLAMAGLFYWGVGRKFLIMLAPQKIAGQALEQIDELFILTDEDYRVVSVNHAVTRRLAHDDRTIVGADARELLGGLEDPSFEPEITTSDGKPLVLSVSQTARTNHLGEIVGRILVARDVTDERGKDAELRRSLAEQKALTHELHHRVRNSLQMIASLIDLKSHRAVSPDAKALVEVLRLRIGAIAHIQNQIYSETEMHAIQLNEAVETLVRHWHTAADADTIELHLNLQAVYVDAGRAIPFALAIAELLSNVRDHAFPGGQPGSVHVSLVPDGESHALLEIRDDGCGFDSAINRPLGGLSLVGMLASQIDAEFRCTAVSGTICTLRIPVDPAG